MRRLMCSSHLDSALVYFKPRGQGRGLLQSPQNLLYLAPAPGEEVDGGELTIVSTGSVRASSVRLASSTHFTDEDTEGQR